MKNPISRRDFLKTTAAVGAGGLLFGAGGCGKGESFFAIPIGMMNTLGEASYVSAMQDYQLSKNTVWSSWVKNSGQRVRDATIAYETERDTAGRLSGFAWSFELIEDSTVNAWCMPGARVAFYEGIIPLCESEDGVGIIMGHEVAHAVYNHSGQRMAQQLTVQLGITALSVAAARILEPDETILEIAMTVFGVGAQVGMLAYSRQHEYEADKMGLIYAAKAGYNPREAIKFWDRMSALGGSSGPDFLSTHPSHENRISRLEEAMPEAMQHYEMANKH